ncbi:hypothetical protein GOL87_28100 [Sinorhizobium medicae]|nr:hypothetical protein [Sinorhizobium medicae]
MKDRLREYITLAVQVIGVLGVFFGVYKYYSDIEMTRQIEARKQALSYVERYGATELRNHRQEALEFWLKHSDVVTHIRKQGASEDAYRAFFFAALDHDQSSKTLLNALYAMNNFYDQVAFCRESRVCDEEVIDAYFCENANIFFTTYDPIFDSLGQMSGVADFGRGARELAKPCASRS